MSGWPGSRVREEMRALNALRQEAQACAECTAKGLWQRFPLRTALMLHSDSAQRARRDGKPPRLQESAASSIARILKNDPSHRSFARRWYGAMAGLAQSENRWGEALDWVKQGLKDFPDAADLLLLLGSIDETRAALAPGGSDDAAPGTIAAELSRLEVEGREARARRREAREEGGRLKEARSALRSALGADPSLSEARLRLGRVAWRLGDTAEARSQLETVLAGTPEAATAFLAHLFLGRLDEDAGRLDEAAQAYEKALEMDPRCQSARLALSHVRFRQGDARAARAEVEAALAAAGRRLRPDAFWLYPWGPSAGVEQRLEALRREASAP